MPISSEYKTAMALSVRNGIYASQRELPFDHQRMKSSRDAELSKSSPGSQHGIHLFQAGLFFVGNNFRVGFGIEQTLEFFRIFE